MRGATEAVSRGQALMSSDEEPSLIGYIALLRMLMSGIDGSALSALAGRLLDRAKRNVNGANSLMDLSWVFLATGSNQMAVSTQALALKLQQLYRLPAPCGRVGLRMLSLLAPGDYLANTPLEFLLEGSDVELDILFVGPQLPLPGTLPEHDVLFTAVCESDENLPLLRDISELLARHPGPRINDPSRIPFLARDRASQLLRSAPGVAMPVSARVDRATLERVGGACTENAISRGP